MKFRRGDILVRKSKDGSVIWVSQRLLVDACGLEVKYLEQAARFRYKSSVQPCHRHHNILPDTAKGWRWAKINNEFYYDLKRIPNRKPTFYRNLFGDAHELVQKYHQAMEEGTSKIFELELNTYIRDTYKNYIPCYIEGCDDRQRIALSKACAIVQFAVVQKIEQQVKGDGIYRDIGLFVEKYDMRYIPKNYRRIKDKVNAVIKEGKAVRDIIKLPRSGNSNAMKYDDPQLLAWGMLMRSMPQNFSNEHIIRKIWAACDLTGKSKPCRRWFGQNIFELQHTKFITASPRFGSGSRRAFSYEGYIPMEGALYAGDCWQVDATRVNIIEHKKDDGKFGFLFVIAVRDVYSGDILGYSFDYSENRWAMNNALQMAANTAGYLPYEIVSDRFPGHNTEEMKDTIFRLETMGVKFTKTHKATGKSHVERSFGTIQSVIMQDSKYYYGEGVKSSRIHAHRSSDYLKDVRKEAKKEGFNVSDAYAECTEIMEAYRDMELSKYSRKHSKVDKSPRMLHEESEKPHVRTIDSAEIQMLFGLKKSISIKHNGMIRTDVQKAEYVYQVEDYEVFSKEESIVMAYDLSDMDRVYLYRKSGQLLVYLCDATLFEKPNPYGPQAEHGKIAKEKKRQRLINERKKEELEGAVMGAGNEVELLMGRHTNKENAEQAETIRLFNSLDNPPIKKAVGYDITDSQNEDDDIDINQIIINKY